MEYDSSLLWKHKPNCSFTTEKGVSYSYNSEGYRDDEHTIKKEDDSFRIVVIGDSVVEGHQIPREERFSDILGKILNEKGVMKYEIINLGVGGYTTQQELEVLKKEAVKYSPDLIIWNYLLNDALNPVFHPISYNSPRYGFQSEWYKPTTHLWALLKKKLFFLREKLRGKNCPKEYHKFLHCAYRDEVIRNIFEIGKVSRESNIPVIFLINPVYYPGAYKNYYLQDLHNWLKEVSAGAGLRTYDLLDEFRKHSVFEVGRCTLRGCDIWHPSPEGHRIIAEYLAGIILNQSSKQ